MAATDPKDDLHRYLRRGREALLAKIDGLSPYDARRPMTPTGTNLLGLVKHVAAVQAEYLGGVFGRPFQGEMPGGGDDDLWVHEGETTAGVVAFFEHSSAHGDATIEALELDAPGLVPWWPEEVRHTSLSRVLVHLTAEVHRHAGHADILRETIDGVVGRTGPGSNIPDLDAAAWAAYCEKIETAARSASE